MKTYLWLKKHTKALVKGACLMAGAAAWVLGIAAASGAEPIDKPVAAKSDVAAPAAAVGAKPGLVSVIAGGREVSVTAAETPAAINVVGPNAEVRVGGQTLLVEKTQLTLDGKPLAELPPQTLKVEVIVDKGMLSVKADAKEVVRAKLGD